MHVMENYSRAQDSINALPFGCEERDEGMKYAH